MPGIPLVERMINKIALRCEIITQENGFNTNIGQHVYVVRDRIDMGFDGREKNIPGIVIFPEFEEPADEIYGADFISKQIRFNVVAEVGDLIRDESPSYASYQPNYDEMINFIGAELIDAFQGDEYYLKFNSGGPIAPVSGSLINGVDSGVTGVFQKYQVDTGDWVTSDATGTLTLRRTSGRFEEGEILRFTGGLHDNEEFAVYGPDNLYAVGSSLDLTTGGVADHVLYVASGVENRPEATDKLVHGVVVFNFIYKMPKGNPFA